MNFVAKCLETVLYRRALRLANVIDPELPRTGIILDMGSGTGHIRRALVRRGREVIGADVSVLSSAERGTVQYDGEHLPFRNRVFAASLLVFVLAYPQNLSTVLSEARRVTSERIIIVQSLVHHPAGVLFLILRELIWSGIGFPVSKAAGFIPRTAKFHLRPRRFLTKDALEAALREVGLEVRSLKRIRPLSPLVGEYLCVAGPAL